MYKVYKSEHLFGEGVGGALFTLKFVHIRLNKYFVGEPKGSIIYSMICDRCGEILQGKQTRWCSKKCSKLGLKSEWRKRNRVRLLEYSRNYRKAKHDGDYPIAFPDYYRDSECLYCGSDEDLQLAHVKPLWAGGKHKWVVTFCRKHHHQFDTILREWWKGSISTNSVRDVNVAPDIARQIVEDMKVLQ